MRASQVIAGAGMGLVLVLGACGQRADQAGPGGHEPGQPSRTEAGTPPASSSIAEPPVTVEPSGTVVPVGVRLLPKGQVDASALPDYYTERNVWAFDGDRSLQMFAMARDACAGVQATISEQSADAVKVVLASMDAPQGGPPDGQMCAQVLTPKPVTVRLDAPVGNRKVYLSQTGF
jgi:multidrug efflux pump subunit AcrA (membrane-fusion protein)